MISIEHSNMELAFADLFGAALTLRRKTAHAIYFAPRAASLRIEILQVAAAESFAVKGDPGHPLNQQKSDALRQLKKIAKRGLALGQRRHDVMHDAWGVSGKKQKGAVLRARINRTISHDATPVPIQALNEIIRDFRALIEDATDLAAKFRRSPPSMADLRKSSTKAGDSARIVSEGKPTSRK
jgi:hypothetical protein